MLHTVDEGAGEAVVLLHAYPCDLHLYDAQADALTGAGYRVIRPDLPGFGQSLPSAQEPSMAVAASEVLSTLSAAGVDSFVLAGLSLGGYVAMEILRQQPDSVTALALIDTKATADTPAARDVREETARTALDAGSLTPLAEGMLTGLLGRGTLANRPDVVERTRGWIAQTSAAAAAWAQRAMAARPDSVGTLAVFERPAVVITGDEDALSPLAEHELMAATLRQSRMVVIQDCGHLSAVEQPQALSEALLEFLGGVRAAGPAL